MRADTKTQTLARPPDHEPPGTLYLLVGLPSGFVAHRLEPGGVVTMGRGPDADVRIDHTSVSRLHAEIRRDSRLEVVDRGSRNGTRLRGRRLDKDRPEPLHVGDVVEVGGVAVLVQQGGSQPVEPGAGDDCMARAHALIDRVAPRDLTVLLRGETGVGKEVCAERIHACSRRADHQLLKINCAALSEALLESELFGYERGAFTGAVSPKPGLLETADGGTVFLDEVGDLPLPLQAKLLRVLEDREVLRLGALKPRRIDVRFVAATNRELERDIVAGRFRRDLYFRIAGVTVEIPPLRERSAAELETIARELLERACREAGIERAPVLTSEALDRLARHRWPGNIRELRNAIERAVAICEDGELLTADHFADLDARPIESGRPPTAEPVERAGARPPDERSAGAGDASGAPSLRSKVAELERQQVIDALEQCGGNQTRAAKLLGIARGTLRARMDAYGIPRPRKS